MVWRRLPTYFPSFPLHLMPITKEQLQQIKETGWLREVVFKTVPSVNKTEIKAFLESVYGMHVDKVTTVNYQGKKKRFVTPSKKEYVYRRPDWKKAYVIFKPFPEQQQQVQE